ncbi:hypothetical protein [Xylanimonas protaetiae]|uniref:Uncharacterized protein n=1 Tax=Xylanimonas protaetiae TaxID=2509457 RepID=A0A4P6F439_9MICO|nr:hypothetical protein [Xylanimonas protaetiae]QAY70045.1 hypothetical protein ET471_08355 [Xylanimonas protaetiae]
MAAIGARYQRALDAKPSKGEYTQKGIDALTDSVCDVPDLLAVIQRVRDLAAEWERDAVVLSKEDNLSYANCTALDARALREALGVDS